MLKRFIRWLLGIPPKDELDAERAMGAERDRRRTRAIEGADRGRAGR